MICFIVAKFNSIFFVGIGCNAEFLGSIVEYTRKWELYRDHDVSYVDLPISYTHASSEEYKIERRLS